MNDSLKGKKNMVEKTVVNINRMRTGDKIKIKSGKELTVGENWTANGIYQLIPVEEPDNIYSYSINGKNLDPHFENVDIIELIEVPNPDDDKVFYLPKFDIDFLPVLTINGEDRITYGLLDLNGVEINTPQVLKAEYKYVVIAMLLKKQGRDIEVLKEEKIICGDKDNALKTLDKISKQFTGENLDEIEIRKIFDNLSEKINEMVDNK